MGVLQKFQNSIQTLIILWSVYTIHINSLFQVIFEELSFCHFPPWSTSILGKDSRIQLNFHLSILVFQTNGKQHSRRVCEDPPTSPEFQNSSEVPSCFTFGKLTIHRGKINSFYFFATLFKIYPFTDPEEKSLKCLISSSNIN